MDGNHPITTHRCDILTPLPPEESLCFLSFLNKIGKKKCLVTFYKTSLSLSRLKNIDLRQIDQKKVFGDILDRKIAFLDYENIDIRKLQNVHFSKCFDQKFEFEFFFRPNRSKKGIFDILVEK